MFIVCPVLRFFIRASAEAHDEPRLRTRLASRSTRLGSRCHGIPTCHRLKALVPHQCEKLKWHDAEQVVDALEELATEGDSELRDILLGLRLTLARLGGVHSAIRLGRLAVDELRSMA